MVDVFGGGLGPAPQDHRVFVWNDQTLEGAGFSVVAVGPGQLETLVGPGAHPMTGVLMVAKGMAYSLPSPLLINFGTRVLLVDEATWFVGQELARGPGTFEVTTVDTMNVTSQLVGMEIRVDTVIPAIEGVPEPLYRLTVCSFPTDGGGQTPPEEPPISQEDSGLRCVRTSLTYLVTDEVVGPTVFASDLAETFNQSFQTLGFEAFAEGSELVISIPDGGVEAGFATLVQCETVC